MQLVNHKRGAALHSVNRLIPLWSASPEPVTFQYVNANLDLWLAIVFARVGSWDSISFHPLKVDQRLN